MNLRRILNLAGALAAVAAAAAVCVVAAAFAVYAAARPYLGAAGSAAAVAAAFALVALVVAWLATRKAAPRSRPGTSDDANLIDRLILLAKERPLVALGAAAAAVTVLLRNPAVITTIVSTVLATGASKPTK